jgi:phosphoribosylformylglycinamidine synthase
MTATAAPTLTFAVIVFPGSNCDRDCEHVLRSVTGVTTRMVWHTEASLDGVDAVIVPGGFSYGDYLRAGAIASVSPVLGALRAFAAAGGLVLGICNGFQVLCEAGLLPGALLHNRSARFHCAWARLRVERADTPFTCAYTPGEVVRFPIAHGEGCYYADAATLEALEDGRRIAFRYVDERGEPTAAANPNGSVGNIAGVLSEGSNVCALMPHPERASEAVLGGTDGARMFASMVTWLEREREPGQGQG